MNPISHITFIVHDLEKAKQFFETVFDAKEIYSSGNKTHSLSKEKFFLIDCLWIAIMEGDSLPSKTYNHIAFKATIQELDNYETRIRKLGLEIKEGRTRIDGEAQALYFYDFDNHLFEIHTGTLEQRMTTYKK